MRASLREHTGEPRREETEKKKRGKRPSGIHLATVSLLCGRSTKRQSSINEINEVSAGASGTTLMRLLLLCVCGLLLLCSQFEAFLTRFVDL